MRRRTVSSKNRRSVGSPHFVARRGGALLLPKTLGCASRCVRLKIVTDARGPQKRSLSLAVDKDATVVSDANPQNGFCARAVSGRSHREEVDPHRPSRSADVPPSLSPIIYTAFLEPCTAFLTVATQHTSAVVQGPSLRCGRNLITARQARRRRRNLSVAQSAHLPAISIEASERYAQARSPDKPLAHIRHLTPKAGSA